MEPNVLEQLKNHFNQGNLIQAEKMALEHLKAEPNHPLLNKMAGVCLSQRQDFQAAKEKFSNALRVEPDDGDCLNNLGFCYLFTHDYTNAADYFLQALNQADKPEWQRNLGTCYYEIGLFNRAVKHYKLAVSAGLNDDMMLTRLIDTLKSASRFDEALVFADKILDNAQKVVEKAAIYVQLNQPANARDCLTQHNDEFCSEQWQKLHNIYRFLGDSRAEKNIVNQFLRGTPEQRLLAEVMGEHLSHQQLSNLEYDPRLMNVNNEIKATFLYILAGHYKKQDKAKWFALLQKANAIQARQITADSNLYRRSFSKITSSYDVYKNIEIEQSSRVPIFILGMPRSGTTLIESILANHNQIFAAGETTLVESLLADLNMELPGQFEPHSIRLNYLENGGDISSQSIQKFSNDYVSGLQKYSPEASHIIDKMPHNFMHLGLIAKAFPNALIVHCRRDPLATCLSIYEQNFSAFHAYSNNLKTLGEYYVEYYKLMSFWRGALGADRIVDISYENLVQEPEVQIRSLLKRLNLEWQDNMLNIANTDRTVTTSSLEQVRQPIYHDSLKSYLGIEDQLTILSDILQVIDSNNLDLNKNTHRGWFARLLARKR